MLFSGCKCTGLSRRSLGQKLFPASLACCRKFATGRAWSKGVEKNRGSCGGYRTPLGVGRWAGLACAQPAARSVPCDPNSPPAGGTISLMGGAAVCRCRSDLNTHIPDAWYDSLCLPECSLVACLLQARKRKASMFWQCRACQNWWRLDGEAHKTMADWVVGV